MKIPVTVGRTEIHAPPHRLSALLHVLTANSGIGAWLRVVACSGPAGRSMPAISTLSLALHHGDRPQLDGLPGDPRLVAGVHHLTHVLRQGTHSQRSGAVVGASAGAHSTAQAAGATSRCTAAAAVAADTVPPPLNPAPGPPGLRCSTAACSRPPAQHLAAQPPVSLDPRMPSSNVDQWAVAAHLVALRRLLHHQFGAGHTDGDALGLERIQHLEESEKTTAVRRLPAKYCPG